MTRAPARKRASSWRSAGRRLASAFGQSVLLLVCAGSSASSEPEPFSRLLDLTGSADIHRVRIGEVDRRILDPKLDSHVFTLTNPPAKASLMFSLGVGSSEVESTARFEIELASQGEAPVQLFRSELSKSGWTDVRLDLSDHDLEGRRLVLRRSKVAGQGSLARFVWGDPVLLAKDPVAGRSVVLVSLDTLRADRVGIYGYSKARTPVLDSLARRGTWYENAYSPSTWTLPSHASLFLGNHRPSIPPPLSPERKRPDPMLSVPEIFRQAGYLTAGFTGGGFVSHNFAFPRGFDTYYMFGKPGGEGCAPERLDGPQVFRRAADWLRDRGSAPFFLFVHTYDVHDRCLESGDGGSWSGPGKLGARDRRMLLEHYDDSIEEVDRLLGSLLAELSALGLDDSTLVVVTSDHGEAFGEHGQKGHGCDKIPYEEVIWVPLIARGPGFFDPAGRIRRPVSLVDVAPSLLSLVGLPEQHWMSGDALPGLGLPVADPPAPVFSHCGDLLAVRDGRFKLITSRDGSLADEVYDVEADRREQRNLSAAKPEVLKKLRALAATFWSTSVEMADEPSPPEQLEEGVLERLRSLGYFE